VRLQREIATTATLKPKKGELQSQGYDPRRIADPMYVLHPRQDAYVPLTPQLFEDIVAGRLPL
jgi:fatty-acyl-CoA synthase